MSARGLNRIYDGEDAGSALALAALLAKPARLSAFLAGLRERRPTAEDHAECIRRAHLESALQAPILSAPTAPPPVAALSKPAAEIRINPS